MPTLLSLFRGKTYPLLRHSQKPATKTFQEIFTTLQQHLSPKQIEIAERSFRFCKQNQRESETALTNVRVPNCAFSSRQCD